MTLCLYRSMHWKYPIDASWEKMRQKIDSKYLRQNRKLPDVQEYITLWSYAAVFYWLYYWQDNIFIIRIKVSGQNLRIATPGLVEKEGSGKSPVLAGRTKVLLNAGTTIQYPTQFDQKERTVSVGGRRLF